MQMKFTITVNDWRDREPTAEEIHNLVADIRSDLETVAYRTGERLDIVLAVSESL